MIRVKNPYNQINEDSKAFHASNSVTPEMSRNFLDNKTKRHMNITSK